jgi:methylenetetrahydrofolate dehydrogenase (NADP+) / methenyltetrahydrofolate cyclohydrolase
MLIDGKRLQQEILDEIGSSLQGKFVVFLQFGENKVSEKYVQAKIKIAKKLGVTTQHVVSNALDTKEAISEIIERSKNIDGIVVQLPMPSSFDTRLILSNIPKKIDIDVLNNTLDNNMIQPVAGAVYKVLENTAIDFDKKNIVILGKGSLVGQPVSAMFSEKKIPYLIFDIDSDQELMKQVLSNADVVVCGMGAPHFLKPEMIKEGVVLVDAGTSEQSGVLLGDIDPACYIKTSAYTPVPGGIGPITLATLFKNMLV